MKKLLFILMLCFMASCNINTVEDKTDSYIRSRFIVLEYTGTWKVVYDYETKVMYTVSMGHYNAGNFTMLVDSTGKPLLWKRE